MIKEIRLLAILPLFLVLTSCANSLTGVEQRTIPTQVQDYTMGVGDKMEITVYNQEKLSGDFTVNSVGDIAFPLLESVRAEGLTTKELEESIKAALTPKYINDPKVSVQLVKRRDIYILGEVNKPGKYEYIPNMTLLEAVATAEGYTPRAAEKSAEIRRKNKDQVIIFEGGVDNVLMPGDTVIIKRRLF